MQVVILAGGFKSTISGEQEGIPKPMAELGGKPILWHIMKSFSAYGINEFIICGGYKIEIIKEYFLDFYIYESDITVDLQNNTVKVHKNRTEDWKVTVVDTGENASVGERVLAIQKYIKGSDFIVSYGDCLSDIDVDALVKCHHDADKAATVVMAKPGGRSEIFSIEEDGCLDFTKAGYRETNAWINANCYVLNKEVFSYLQSCCDLEKQFLRDFSGREQLVVYRHDGYWTAVETKRDLVAAEALWNQGNAPWMGKKK